jgi:hypothetical protein
MGVTTGLICNQVRILRTDLANCCGAGERHWVWLMASLKQTLTLGMTHLHLFWQVINFGH